MSMRSALQVRGRARTSAAVTALVATAAACGTSDDSTSALVEWRVETTPVFDTGRDTPTGEAYLAYASGAAVLSNGNVAIADRYGATVHIADSTGRLIRSVGRRGTGPGEFGDIRGLMSCGADSLFVWDYRPGHVTVLDSAGAFVRQFRPTGRAHALACARSGTLAVMDMPAAGQHQLGSESVVQTTMWIGNTTGAVLHHLGEIPFGQVRVLGRLTHFAITDDALFIGTADSTWLDLYTPDGRKADPVRIATTRRVPTPRHMERAIEDMVSVATDAGRREQMRENARKSSIADVLPPYREIFADQHGRIWVTVSSAGDEQTELRVLDRTGAEMAIVRLPGDVRVLDINHDRIVGVLDDETGLQRVVAWRYVTGP